MFNLVKQLPLIVVALSKAPKWYPIAVQQALSGAGAISIATYYTAFTSTAAGNALTLADGTYTGHVKKIKYIAEGAGGDTGVLTPAHFGTSTTITLNAIGDYVKLVWDGAKWVCVENFGGTIA